MKTFVSQIILVTCLFINPTFGSDTITSANKEALRKVLNLSPLEGKWTTASSTCMDFLNKEIFTASENVITFNSNVMEMHIRKSPDCIQIIKYSTEFIEQRSKQLLVISRPELISSCEENVSIDPNHSMRFILEVSDEFAFLREDSFFSSCSVMKRIN